MLLTVGVGSGALTDGVRVDVVDVTSLTGMYVVLTCAVWWRSRQYYLSSLWRYYYYYGGGNTRIRSGGGPLEGLRVVSW